MKIFIAALLFTSHVFAQNICSEAFAPELEGRAAAERRLTNALDDALNNRKMESIEEWVADIQHVADQTSFREHMALVLIRGMGMLDGKAGNELDDAIKTSYRHLTGQSKVDYRRLPVGVVRGASEYERAFYNAVQVKLAQGEMLPLRQRFVNKMLSIRDNTSVMKAVTLLSGIAAMIVEPNTRGVIAGSILGLAQAGMIEYTIHLGLGHASSKTLAFLHKFGTMGDFMEEVGLEHKLHHMLVAKDFRAAVLSPEQEEYARQETTTLMRQLLIERAKRKNPALTREQIINEPGFNELLEQKVQAVADANWGMNSSIAASAKMLVSGIHFYLMNLGLFVATHDVGFLIASNTVMSVMTVQSIYSHYYMHYFPEFRTAQGTTKWMVSFLNSKPGQLMRRRHIEHHYDRYIGAGNGNIMAFAPADYILLDLTELSIRHLVEMQADGILPEI